MTIRDRVQHFVAKTGSCTAGEAAEIKDLFDSNWMTADEINALAGVWPELFDEWCKEVEDGRRLPELGQIRII